jgi:hypothetical protein
VFINSYLDTFLQKHWQDATLGRASPADLIVRWLTNIHGHATDSLPKLLFPTLQSPRLLKLLPPLHLEWAVPAFNWAVAGAIVAGFVLRLRQGLRPVELYVLLYLGFILMPGWYTFRNLVPILAFLYLYVVTLLRSVAAPLARLAGRPFAAQHLGLTLSAAFVLLSATSNSLSMVGTNFEMGARFRASRLPYVEEVSFFEACRWIEDNTRPEARVLYRSSEKMYICSGRQASPSLSTFPVSLGARDQSGVIQAAYQEADYVVTTSTDTVDPALTASEPIDFQSTAFLHSVLEQDPTSFALIFETSGAPTMRIYQVLRAEP